MDLSKHGNNRETLPFSTAPCQNVKSAGGLPFAGLIPPEIEYASIEDGDVCPCVTGQWSMEA